MWLIRNIAMFCLILQSSSFWCNTALVGQGFVPSLSFSHMEMKDVFHYGVEVNVIDNIFIEDNYVDALDESMDIRSVDYSANRMILNTTLWLSKPIGPDYNLSQDAAILIYGILTDADSNQAAGNDDGVECQVKVQWNSQTKTWIGFSNQYSSAVSFEL
jgi:hypothetical protein